MSDLFKFNIVKFFQINAKDTIPLFFLILVGLFPSFPPAIQAISIIAFVICSLIIYVNNIGVNFKKKLISFLILTGYYLFALFTYFWTNDKTQFRTEIRSNISLILISFVAIFLMPKLSEKYIKFFLLTLVFGFLIYLFFWYSYIVQGIIIFEKFNYGITDFMDKSAFERFSFLVIEFFGKFKSYSQLGMDGYHYFAPNLYKDFFVHHSYTSAIALVCILVCIHYLKSANRYLKFIFFLLVLIFSIYIFYVDSQVNKFLYLLFSLIFITWYCFKKWKCNLFVIVGLIVTLFFIKKVEITEGINHLIITTEKENDYNQGVDFVRYSLYKEAFSIFKNNMLLGLGLGDYKAELNKNIQFSSIHYNSHSQYIYYAMVGGVFNLLLFIISQLFCVYKLFHYKDVFLLSFCVICIANCLFENFLNRLWGVWMYSVFFILFTNRYLYFNNE